MFLTRPTIDACSDATAPLFDMVRDLIICYPNTECLEKVLPVWISYAHRLESIALIQIYGLEDALNTGRLEGLASSLRAAKQLKEVRIIGKESFDRIPLYTKKLSVLVHPHYSLLIQTSRLPDWMSDELSLLTGYRSTYRHYNHFFTPITLSSSEEVTIPTH